MKPTTIAVRRTSLQQQRRVVKTRATSGVALDGTLLRSVKDWKQLRDPAHIYAVGNKSVRVQNYGGDVSLQTYMTLPVHQYYVLDPHLITSLGKNTFEFNVPKLQLFNEWIQPNVVATVNVCQDHVRIATDDCSMLVSDMISTLDIDQQWHMNFESTLTWDNDSTESDKNSRGFDRILIDSTTARSGASYGIMHGKSRVDVWCELAPGFTFMPRDVLQNACNLALSTLMQSLLPVFMTQLSEDYKQWATSEAYREERKSWNIERFKKKSA